MLSYQIVACAKGYLCAIGAHALMGMLSIFAYFLSKIADYGITFLRVFSQNRLTILFWFLSARSITARLLFA